VAISANAEVIIEPKQTTRFAYTSSVNRTYLLTSFSLMVTPKKPSAPGLNSRTNSTQADNRSSKSKSPASAGSSLASKDVTDLSTNKKSSGKAKKKAGKQRGTESSGSIFMERLVLLFLALFSVYAVTTCPSDLELDNPVCHSLSLYRQHVLEPYILPPIYQVLDHPAVTPYVEKAVDAQRAIKPYYVAADVRLRPYGRKTKEVVWDGLILPIYNKQIIPLYYQHVSPHVRLLQDKISPFVEPAYDTFSSSASQAQKYIQLGYEKASPYVQDAYSTAQPYASKALEQARPLALKAYDNARVYSIKAYTVSEPYVRLAYSNLLLRLKLAIRTLGKWRKLYVDKHVFKIWDKVVELSGDEVQTSASRASPVVAETVEPTQEPTPVIQAETADIPITSEEPVVSEVSPEVPEEPAAPTVSPSAEEIEPEVTPDIPEELVPPTTSSSIPAASASSIQQQASQMLEDVPVSVAAVFEEFTSSLAAGSESVAASVSFMFVEHEASASTTLDVPEPTIIDTPEIVLDLADEEPSDEDDGLDDLLASLGLDDDAQEAASESPETVILEDVPVATETISPEEKAARKKEKTARDRAKLEKKHQEWFDQLDELIDAQSKQVRELLDAIRTAATGALWDRADIPSSVEVANFNGLTSQDYDTMIFVDGQRVSKLMDKLSADGEQLLKGLEAYLKREAKPSRAVIFLDERRSKWTNVLGKVEEKFTAAAEEMQDKVRQWFVAVRDIEIREVC
jgi:hypothetical protein